MEKIIIILFFLFIIQYSNHLFFPTASLGSKLNLHFPKTIGEWIFFPFYFSLRWFPSQAPFRDYRWITLFVLFSLFLIKLAYSKLSGEKLRFNNKVQFFLTFFITSYIVWEMVFSVRRYAVVLALIAPIIIYIIIDYLLGYKKIKFILFCSIFLFILATVVPMKWGRGFWNDRSYVEVNIPTLVNLNTKGVVIIQKPPVAFVIPSFPEDWRFIWPHLPYQNKELLQNHIRGMISKFRKMYKKTTNLYVLTLSNIKREDRDKFLKVYKLRIFKSCVPIENNMGVPLSICKVIPY